MYYVDIFSLEEVTYVTNGTILANNAHDTLRLLDIWFRTFANNVRDTKYHKHFSL